VDDALFSDGHPDADDHFFAHRAISNSTRNASIAKHILDRPSSTASHPCEAPTLSRFHFTGHASIALRTPSHVVRTFVFFSIAAIAPISDGQHATKSARLARAVTAVPGCWYVGVFGRWWHIGPNPLENLAFGFAKSGALIDDDARAGSLAVRVIKAPAQFGTQRGVRRPIAEQPHAGLLPAPQPPRPGTPPPLPKSASLPLHDARRTLRVPDPAPPLPPPPESPIIAELLAELTQAQTSVAGLRVRLTAAEESANKTRAALEAEAEAAREAKRAEDATRTELRTRTKALEDSRRHTDATKRDAEKRLKTAQGAHEGALAQIDSLGKELEDLQQATVADGDRTRLSAENATAALAEVSKEADRRRQEVKIAEGVIASLSARSRELEDQIAQETAKLDQIRQRRIASVEDEIVIRDSPPPLERVAWPPPPQPVTAPLETPRTILRRPQIPPTQPARANSLTASFDISKGYSIFSPDIAASASTSTFAPFSDVPEPWRRSTLPAPSTNVRLNPDAKVFRPSPAVVPPPPSSTTPAFTSSLRAFAPSPAERAALAGRAPIAPGTPFFPFWSPDAGEGSSSG